MPLVYQKPAVSLAQKRLALIVAGIADFIQIMVFPAFVEGGFSPPDDVLDIVVAVILMAVCGFRWQWVLAFLMEIVPGIDILPTWTMVVALMPAQESQAMQEYEVVEVEQVEGYVEGEGQAMEVYEEESMAGGEVQQTPMPPKQLLPGPGGVVVPPVRVKGI